MRIRGYAPATPCWTELASNDPAASAAFYSGLFGWHAAPTDVGSTVFTRDELAVTGMVPTTEDQPTFWLTYFSTEDIAATAGRVTDAGGTVLRPPTEVGTRGQLALFADPEGAVFGVWQRGTFRGAQLVSEPNTVCWSDVASRDMAGASAFYGKVFGWADQPGGLATTFEYWEWSVDNRVVAGMIPMGEQFPDEVPAHWRTTFEVEDCAATAARCAELGGQALMGPLDAVVGQYAQLMDPQGGLFGVIELIPELRLTP